MSGLSCYTANLARYLAGEWDGAGMLAGSVRLAVRVDRPDGQLAFSHHAVPMDRLPDGTRLRYAGAADPRAALPDLAAEVEAYGRVLVVADSMGLPWSPGFGRTDAAAPHWLLVDGHRARRWHVVDDFAGLLPSGRQDPFEGWLSRTQLCAALVPGRWTAEQHRRNTLAFGFPVPVPDGGVRWLHRTRDDGRSTPLPGRWLRGPTTILPYLAEHLTGPVAAAQRHLDDWWAAAGHQAYVHHWFGARSDVDGARRHLRESAEAKWADLPRILRYAVESAGRGRPRPALVHRAVDDLLEVEAALLDSASPAHATKG